MDKKRLSLLSRIFFVIFLCSLTLTIGFYIGQRTVNEPRYPTLINLSRELPENQKELDFQLFWRVWDTLESQYFDKNQIVESRLVLGAIKGMVEAVGDPYTVFLTPEENRVSTEDLQGDFEGVGIQIGYRGQQLAVIAPLPGSPAEKAGLKAGDFIVGIKDESAGVDRGTVGISLPDAVQVIRGKSGSVVTLIVLRDGEDAPLAFDVVRESIDVPSVVLAYLNSDGDEVEDANIAAFSQIRVLRFGEGTLDEWNDAVTDILTHPNVNGVIVDLRNNPGGYLNRSVDLAADFMDTNSLVTFEEHGDGSRDEYRTTRIGRLTNSNVVVLINGGSASASEILAGAMRDNSAIPLVGETSFGKGTIQEAQQLENGAGLHITIAKWLTPSGFWVNNGGLQPDVSVVDSPDTAEDEQVLEAIKLISLR